MHKTVYDFYFYCKKSLLQAIAILIVIPYLIVKEPWWIKLLDLF
jgi:hypothetical protein